MLIRYESTAGLTTVGYRILNADKTEYAALTTTGVTEVSPGGYGVTVADSILAGRTVEWYEGAAYSVAESFPTSVADSAAIKAKTDALPTDPADQSAVEAAIAAAQAAILAAMPDDPDNAGIAVIRAILGNRWVESADGSTITVYDTDDTTPLGTFAWSEATRTRGRFQ